MRELDDTEIHKVARQYLRYTDGDSEVYGTLAFARAIIRAASAAPAEGPETVDERAAFEREHDRYFVIKRKDLDIDQLRDLTAFIDHGDIPTRQCVVVEEDWPEYEPVWAMIEARMTGRAALATAPTMSEAVLDKVRKAATRYDEMMNHLGGCTDGGCVIKRPTGMHTNGGCKCPADKLKMQRAMYVANDLRAAVAETDRAAAKGGSDV